MIRTNCCKLPVVSVSGKVWHPKMTTAGRTTIEGNVVWLPGTGGITFNAKIGDNCINWAADHLEPGATVRHKDNEHNEAVQLLSCVGNVATVVSGDAKGQKGIVTGKHGGSEHLIVYFPLETLEKMNINDSVGIRTVGLGMTLTDYPDVTMYSTSPALFNKMNITESNGVLQIGVAKIIPAAIMGSGLGMIGSSTGDYDICLTDKRMIDSFNLHDLRFGDIVAITDADQRFGRSFCKGACSIGVVVHGNSRTPGHGPGVTTLMSSVIAGQIAPFIDKNANLAQYFL
jgi:hypothetical protein